MDNLRKLMWSKDQLISPGGFIKAIQYVAKQKKKDIFTGYAQNDVSEFLLFIVDCLHSGLKREVNMTINGTVQNEFLNLLDFRVIHSIKQHI